jgi:hypothetical protein
MIGNEKVLNNDIQQQQQQCNEPSTSKKPVEQLESGKMMGTVHLSLSDLKGSVRKKELERETLMGTDDDRETEERETYLGAMDRETPLMKESNRPYSIAIETRPESDLGRGPHVEGEISTSGSRTSHFPLSSDKRNEEFHELFRALPVQESLISG